MRAVVQRVSSAEVSVDGKMIGSISSGLIVYLGVASGDGQSDVDYTTNKILGLRVFPDHSGVMNRSILDLAEDSSQLSPGILVVSQFTLYGDVRKGRRPSYNSAAEPDHARSLYQQVVQRLLESGLRVETGAFREHMHVWSLNDGPVTILMDSAKLF